MHQKQEQTIAIKILFALLALIVVIQSVAAVITVQIGGATRLTSLNRQRDRYSCYWDCDLVGCQIARDDDECAYDCEKICRVKYDYSGAAAAASGRSGATIESNNDLAPKSSSPLADQLFGKSSAPSSLESQTNGAEQNESELLGAGTSVRLHLPRNASARNFAIWERCAADANTGKLTEKPFNL